MIKVCKWCGIEFTPKGKEQYCGEFCLRIAKSEREKERYRKKVQQKGGTKTEKKTKVYTPRRCKTCGREYIPGSGSSKYCSVECIAEAAEQRKAEREYKNIAERKKENLPRKNGTHCHRKKDGNG